MNARRLFIPALAALILSSPAFADRDERERRRIEDRIEWLKQKVAQEQERLAQVDARILEAERKRAGTNPGPIASTDKTVAGDTDLQPGQLLQVKWGGTWWAARVVALLEGGKVRIHYVGWSRKYDEVVSRARLQLDDDAENKAKNSLQAQPRIILLPQPARWQPLPKSDRGHVPASGKPVDENTSLQPEQKVLVQWGRTWWRGTVLNVHKDGRVDINYTGWADSWNETVPRTRLQLP